MPLYAFVTTRGAVVTFDQHGRAGFDHALVIYGANGSVVKDWKLDELLTDDERVRISWSVSSRWWWDLLRPPTFEPEGQGHPFRISIPVRRDLEFKTIEVDMATGKRL